MTQILFRDRRKGLHLRRRVSRDAPLDPDDTVALKDALTCTRDYTP